MKIRAFSKREKFIIFLTLTIFIGSLVFNLLFNMFSKLDGINQEIESKTALLQRHFRLINKGADIRSLYESYRNILEAEINPQEADADLFKEVGSLAQKVNLNIERIKPLPIQVSKGYTEIFLEVELTGTPQSVFQFINDLEKSLSFIKILSLRVYPQAGVSSVLRCRINLSKLFFS